MTPAASVRPLLLAAVALLAVLAALATQRRVDPPAAVPAVFLPAGAHWQQAVAAPLAAAGGPGGCAFRLGPETLAVTHPVLPCGTRVVIDAGGGRLASVQVAGRVAAPGSAAFGLLPALARAIGVDRPVAVRWALAAG